MMFYSNNIFPTHCVLHMFKIVFIIAKKKKKILSKYFSSYLFSNKSYLLLMLIIKVSFIFIVLKYFCV